MFHIFGGFFLPHFLALASFMLQVLPLYAISMIFSQTEEEKKEKI